VEDVDVGRRIILKWILSKRKGARDGLNWFRTKRSSVLVCT
jgi:hypothetical protein